MKKTVKFLPYFLFIGLLIVLAGSVGLGLAQQPMLLQGPEPPVGEEVSIDAKVGSKFSYQGVLKESGRPVTSRRDMTFRLYSDETCATQVGSDIVRSGVQVTSGLFSVELDVAHSDINGQGLWLDVDVGGAKTSCQEILAAPYALSLRPGAIISDTGSYVELNRSQVQIPTAKYGMYAKAEGEHAMAYYGLYGSGSDYGVYGHSEGEAAIYGSGDVKQSLSSNGLVKAAVYTYCGYCISCSPDRNFNNVNNFSIECDCGASAGRCSIDLRFDISERYWVAMAVDETADYGVTCQEGYNPLTLVCSRWQAGTGLEKDGYIMLLVY